MGIHISKSTKRSIQGVGEIVLVSYLLAVVGIAILRVMTGFPTVADLASSPALLAQGEWWRLFTSAFVVNGPAVPQVLAIAALGTIGIYFGGSLLFWESAVAGHLLGTLLAYVGFSVLWLVDRAAEARFVTDPDYGVSLIWCAALGAFAALSWLGAKQGWRRPARPLLALLAVGIMVVVTAYSDDMAAVQHVIAFVVGVVIIGSADRARVLRDRKPMRRGRASAR